MSDATDKLARENALDEATAELVEGVTEWVQNLDAVESPPTGRVMYKLVLTAEWLPDGSLQVEAEDVLIGRHTQLFTGRDGRGRPLG